MTLKRTTEQQSLTVQTVEAEFNEVEVEQPASKPHNTW